MPDSGAVDAKGAELSDSVLSGGFWLGFDRATDESSETVDNSTPLQVYGKAVGHFVALIRAQNDEAGETLQLIVGHQAGEAVETVAILPDTAAGEAEAEATAHAILGTLAIVRKSFVGCPSSPALDS